MGGVLLYTQEASYSTVLRASVQETVEEKYHSNNTATTLYWDHIQQGLECCGSSGPLDWARSVYNGYQHNSKEIGIGSGHLSLPFTIPSSCCRDMSDPLCSGTLLPRLRPGLDPAIYYTEGCLSKLSSIVEDNLIVLASSGLGVLVLEILGLLLACCVCCTSPRRDEWKT